MDNMILKLDDTIVEIQIDDNRRYCLNDIYKASVNQKVKNIYTGNT